MPVDDRSASPVLSAAIGIAVGLALLALAEMVTAGEARVAIAANFTAPAKAIGSAFTAATGHSAVLSFGSTGQIYAQITHGAPFDVFLAADASRPAQLVDAGLAVGGSRITYVTGRLALYSASDELVDGPETLERPLDGRIALANPDFAPYGAAAVQTLRALGAYERLAPHMVTAKNVAQAFQFVATGNAPLGFVALSQVIASERGSHWVVPEALHAPIAQQAVLLARGADNEAARAFLAFLRGAEAAAVTARFGYGHAGAPR